jgi:fucose 4-O-acetylase-like acetyltransferase
MPICAGITAMTEWRRLSMWREMSGESEDLQSSQRTLTARLRRLHRNVHRPFPHKSKTLLIPFAIMGLLGLAVYDMRLDILDGSHGAIARLCVLLLLYFAFCFALFATTYWYMDRHGKLPAARHCCIDAAILVFPLAFSTLPFVQHAFPSFIEAIIIAGTLVALLIVVMLNVFRK